MEALSPPYDTRDGGVPRLVDRRWSRAIYHTSEKKYLQRSGTVEQLCQVASIIVTTVLVTHDDKGHVEHGRVVGQFSERHAAEAASPIPVILGMCRRHEILNGSDLSEHASSVPGTQVTQHDIVALERFSVFA